MFDNSFRHKHNKNISERTRNMDIDRASAFKINICKLPEVKIVPEVLLKKLG
jgi:hypothetical protein